jgi:hypothetical protein
MYVRPMVPLCVLCGGGSHASQVVGWLLLLTHSCRGFTIRTISRRKALNFSKPRHTGPRIYMPSSFARVRTGTTSTLCTTTKRGHAVPLPATSFIIVWSIAVDLEV